MRDGLAAPKRSTWQPTESLTSILEEMRHQLLSVNETLVWLHQRWDLRPAIAEGERKAEELGAAGGGRPGRGVDTKRVVQAQLGPYLAEEHELVANLVRMVDVMAKRIDLIEANQQRVLGAVRSELLDLAAFVDDRLEILGAIPAGA
ncbi:MAG TPA: hypothetical protein VGS21_02770 [Acidimicrobiales bacterium]|nr:hypothetical protein [Acidimicrobiales bacterium]